MTTARISQPAALPLGQVWRPAASPWLIAAAVMAATFMEVLDTSVANVALPHIAGSMSASTDEATWVLTSYLVSNAIVLPATAWLSSFFGRKRFLIACIVIFTIASGACGMAPSLGFLIVARVLQGAGGGALQPISQAVLLESFPPNRRGVAMAVFGVGVVVAPILGPTLGGWITDNYSWRWVFYINLPVGVIAILMAQTFIEDPPYIRAARAGKIDFAGLGLLAIWVAALQVMLDKGQESDWFSSGLIQILAVVGVLGFFCFLARELTAASPIVNFRVLGDRNFAVGTTMMMMLGGVLYGSIAMLPLFLQTLMGYTAVDSGLAISPRGFGSLAAMLVVGRIIGVIDSRMLIAGGFAVLGGSLLMFGQWNLQISRPEVIWPNILNGLATAFIFVPLTTLTMGTLRNEQMGNATGIFNLLRNLGGSVGISLTQTFLVRDAQGHQSSMVSHLTPFSPAYQRQLHVLAQGLRTGVGPVASGHAALGITYSRLLRQAELWAYVDGFRLLALLCFACIPGVLLFRRPRGRGGSVVMH